jgi:hypothetical protein
MSLNVKETQLRELLKFPKEGRVCVALGGTGAWAPGRGLCWGRRDGQYVPGVSRGVRQHRGY